MTAYDDFITALDDNDRTFDSDEWEQYSTLDSHYEPLKDSYE